MSIQKASEVDFFAHTFTDLSSVAPAPVALATRSNA
jgi:hypothetical protein